MKIEGLTVYTYDELAEETGVSECALRKYRRRYGLGFSTCGGNSGIVLFSENELAGIMNLRSFRNRAGHVFKSAESEFFKRVTPLESIQSLFLTYHGYPIAQSFVQTHVRGLSIPVIEIFSRGRRRLFLKNADTLPFIHTLHRIHSKSRLHRLVVTTYKESCS